jgi:type III secretion system FlhB-like substrate exporter
MLLKIEISDEIPEELFQSVAEIFAYVYKVERGEL